MCYVLLHHKLFQKSTRLTISLQPSISSVHNRPQAAKRLYLEPRQNNPSVVIRMAGRWSFDLHRTTDMQRRSVRDSAANGRMENLALYCVGDTPSILYRNPCRPIECFKSLRVCETVLAMSLLRSHTSKSILMCRIAHAATTALMLTSSYSRFR